MIKTLKHPETGEVIWLEAEPVLDLLEQVVNEAGRAWGEPDRDKIRPAEDLLTAHGRLDG